MTLTLSGSGSEKADQFFFRSHEVSASADGSIVFEVTGQPTVVPISVSLTVPPQWASQATCRLRDPNSQVIGEIIADHDGQHGSFPQGALSPGLYSVELNYHYQTLLTEGFTTYNFDFSAAITVNGTPPTPTAIQWNNPNGGAFHTASNWDPQVVPGTSNTAIFGLQTAYLVDVSAATTERLEIRNGDVTFTNASYTVAATAFDPAGIVLDNSILTLADGSLNGVNALIGDSAAARVDVLSGADLNLSGSLRVGGPGEGFLIIEDGLVTSGEGRIGNGVGGGTVELSNPGNLGLWNSGNLSVGHSGEGTLIINDGAVVTSGLGFVGFGTNTTGVVTIQGILGTDFSQPSTWRLNDGLTVGVDGTGTVIVLDHGVLDAFAKTTVNGTLFIGGGAFSSHISQPVTIGGAHEGEVTVTGVVDPLLPARMNNITDLTVGESARGRLNVQDGGFVSCSNATFGVNAVGAALISGFNQNASELTVASQLTIGKNDQSGFTGLLISDGGQVSAHDVTVGSQPGAYGLLQVFGKSAAGPSSLSATQNLILGLQGKGIVLVQEDAVITCSAAALGVFAGSEGGASLGVDGAPGAPAQWVVNGDMMLGGPGTGTIALHNGANVSVGQTLFILTNGSIGGTGTYSATKVENSGTVSPGNSVGTLIINGDYTQTATGRLAMEIGGLDPGVSHDQLVVNGPATLDGTLELRFINGFAPKQGDTFSFLHVGGAVSANFASVIIKNLSPDFQFNVITNGTNISLVASNDGVFVTPLQGQISSSDAVNVGGISYLPYTLNGVDPCVTLEPKGTFTRQGQDLFLTLTERTDPMCRGLSTDASTFLPLGFLPTGGYVFHFMSDGVEVFSQALTVAAGTGQVLDVERASGGNLKLTIHGLDSVKYMIESSADLKTWSNVPPPLGTVLGPYSILVPLNMEKARCFYRVRIGG